MHTKAKLFLLLACISFVALAFLVRQFPHSSLEIHISKEVQEEVDEVRTIQFARPIAWISILGNGIVAPISVFSVIMVLLVSRYPKEALYASFTFMADILVLILKVLIGRPRPTEDAVHILQKFEYASFPSGHVVHYVVFFGFLLFIMFYKKMLILPVRIIFGLFIIFLMVSISISRIYMGAHWATDVIGGYLVGFIFLLILLGLYVRGDSKGSMSSNRF